MKNELFRHVISAAVALSKSSTDAQIIADDPATDNESSADMADRIDYVKKFAETANSDQTV